MKAMQRHEKCMECLHPFPPAHHTTLQGLACHYNAKDLQTLGTVENDHHKQHMPPVHTKMQKLTLMALLLCFAQQIK